MGVIAVFPGTFDPITHGHRDLVERASRICERLIVAVADSEKKQPLFSRDERVALARRCLAHVGNVSVSAFDGLLARFADELGATLVVRGLRSHADFDFELQVATVNRQLVPGLETMFLHASREYSFLSSSIVREVAQLGGSVEDFVPEPVIEAFRRRLGTSTADH